MLLLHSSAHLIAAWKLDGFFFYQGFLSKILTINRTAGEGRGPSFIPFYHFNPLANIETFICNFACEMTMTYFQSQRWCLPDWSSMRFTTLSNYLLNDWLRMQCLLIYLMMFVYYHPCITRRSSKQNLTSAYAEVRHALRSSSGNRNHIATDLCMSVAKLIVNTFDLHYLFLVANVGWLYVPLFTWM